MSFKLPELPYNKNAFEGIMSAQTFEFHYGKHHAEYVKKLNELSKGTEWEKKTLDEIVMHCKDQKIFNNAAQHWNHTFFWNCISPQKTQPSGQLKEAIVQKWGSVSKCLEEFCTMAVSNFGSGWTWLVKKGNDVSIMNTSNAGNPIASDFVPLLTVDVWEHAYYIDYRNARPKFLENFTKIVNWKFVEANFMSEKVSVKL